MQNLLENLLSYVGIRSSLWGAGRHERFDGVLQAFQVAMDNRAYATILRPLEARGNSFWRCRDQAALAPKRRQTLRIRTEGRVSVRSGV